MKIRPVDAALVWLLFTTTGAVCGGSEPPKTCDPPCFTWQYCDPTRGACMAARCATSADCGSNTVCDSASRCQPLPCRTDAECNDGLFCNGVERCVAASADSPSGCRRGVPPCAGTEACSELLRACGTCATNPDADGDGHWSIACGGDDCDDTDPNRYPGNVETCGKTAGDETHDEDCNASTFGDKDRDADGHVDAACCNVGAAGVPNCGDDCNDADQGVHPGLAEVCDHKDNDCNGMVDEGVAIAAYYDYDRDGAGAPGTPVAVCPQDMGNGYAFFPDDCDDKNSAIVPGAVRCGATSNAVQICQRDATWLDAACATPQQACVTQPNGTGICR